MWHKTLVYFGLVEDDPETEYGEEEEHLAAHRELEESYAERPNVRKLSRVSRRGRVDYDDIYPEEKTRKVNRVRPLRPAVVPVSSSVHLVLPKNFNDAQQVADKFKSDVPVILNLQNADTDLAKRLIDFSSGLTYALDGGMQRVADKVFLLTPQNMDVSAEEKARLLEKGFFNQS
jgi:cell division inhibitor SepF